MRHLADRSRARPVDWTLVFAAGGLVVALSLVLLLQPPR